MMGDIDRLGFLGSTWKFFCDVEVCTWKLVTRLISTFNGIVSAAMNYPRCNEPELSFLVSNVFQPGMPSMHDLPSEIT